MRVNVRPIYNEDDRVKPRMITIISAAKVARVRLDDIELVEKDGRVLHIVTADRDYSVYESMATIDAMLKDDNFFRPIKGLIINFDHVRDIDDGYVNFESGQSVVLGHNNICRTRNEFRRYLMSYPPYGAEYEELRLAEEQK